MKRPSAKGNSAVWRLGLILLLSVALWPLSLRAEAPIGRFVIGVWSPAGWSGADRDSYDRFFTQSDADHLSELGVNLLVQTPRIGHRDRKDYRAVDPANREEADAHEIMQDLEEGIIGKFKTHGGLVIEQSAEEDLPEEDPARGEPTTYTSEFPIGDRLIDFAGVRGGINEYKVKQQVIALSNKWGGTDYVDGFFGYFIGHERYPKWDDGFQGGIYDSATYTNLGKVIDAIRERDTTRAIVAVGNTSSTDAWSATEQEAFWRAFFRSAQDPGPANILMNEHYVFHCGTDTKAEVQDLGDVPVQGSGPLWTRGRRHGAGVGRGRAVPVAGVHAGADGGASGGRRQGAARGGI